MSSRADDLERREDPYNVTNASRIYFLPNLMTAGIFSADSWRL